MTENRQNGATLNDSSIIGFNSSMWDAVSISCFSNAMK